MPRIGNWKKIKDRKTEMIWENSEPSRVVIRKIEYKYNPAKMWQVISVSGGEEELREQYWSKREAMREAMNYMKMHPTGELRSMTTFPKGLKMGHW